MNSRSDCERLKLVVGLVVHEKYQPLLGRALRSLAQQTLPAHHYRVVTVSNGCADDRAAIETTELPLGSARNVAINSVSSEYIACVDADDWVEPEMLELMVTTLDGHPEVDAVWCDVHEMHKLSESVSHETWVANMSRQGSAVLACASMYRRECFDAIGGYSSITRGDSVDFWGRFHAAGFKSQHLASPLYFYRQHDSNMHNQPR